MKADLQKYSYRELMELKQNIDIAIEAKRQSEKSNIKSKVRALIEEAGFDVGEIVGNGSSRSLKGRKVAPKYRNPKNPEETWTGRGRQPKWLAAELARGRTLNSFLIK